MLLKMLLTQDFIGHLQMQTLCTSVLSLSGGVESQYGNAAPQC